MKRKKTKVLILGAGLSGIRAAKTLLDRNITDILILEGESYTGGRIHALKFADYTVEAGANWIHLVDDDETKPLVQRKEAGNIRAITCNYSDIIVRDDEGKDITDFAVLKEFNDKVEHKIEGYQNERKMKKFSADMPARVGFQLMGWKGKRPVERAIEYLNVDFEYAKPPEEFSFYNLFERGKDFFVTDERGLWALYEDLYKPLQKNTLLGKTVTKITLNPDSVEAQTSDGWSYQADYALCTFSSGVLASGLVTFEPALPDWKKEAIYKNPLSLYTKIYLKFPKKFRDDHEYILYASNQRGRFPVWQDLLRPGIYPVSSGILLITVTGAEGRRIEGQSFNETKEEIMGMLKEIYGNGIPEATDIYYRRWSKEPLMQGAYSEPVVGMTSEDWENIGKNLGRLYFAGEATSEEWYGYMQGAYLTGDQNGKMIAEKISPSEPSSKPEKRMSEATLANVSTMGILLLQLLPLSLIPMWN
ncbi:Polyamine oxidase [Stylophora pistillata]|uniref:Amine oxidase n=2 Tax=Stylophora pistillata TaxID=50429 RepID=A0A2B4RNQ6_STYPI|nr:Polyamine oxidase [Stylophora pistillata]